MSPSLHVEIEPTNICNTRRLHCPHEALSRPYGKMDWETYQAILDKVMVYSETFSLQYAGMGEPLLNPLLYDFIRYVSAKAPTAITTNASALTRHNLEKLAEAGLRDLTISFNGTDPEIYTLMMGGLNFERAESNLRQAIELSRGTQMQVNANVSVTRQTQDQLDGIRHYLEDAGVSGVYFSKCHHRGGYLKGDLVCNTPPPPAADDRCDIFTQTLFVSWTGEVLSCCHDLAGANVVGDLRSQSIEAVLANKARIALKGVRFDICKGCNDLYRYMTDRTPDGRAIGDWVYSLYSREEVHYQLMIRQAIRTASSRNGCYRSMPRKAGWSSFTAARPRAVGRLCRRALSGLPPGSSASRISKTSSARRRHRRQTFTSRPKLRARRCTPSRPAAPGACSTACAVPSSPLAAAASASGTPCCSDPTQPGIEKTNLVKT